MMKIKETQLKPADVTGSGQVCRFTLPGSEISVTRITTFNPGVVSPGPAHVYLVEGESLLLFDTGLPTNTAKLFSYTWQDAPVPDDVEALPDDFSFQQIVAGIELAGHTIEDIEELVISHGHPDHFFNGGAIVERSGANVTAHIMDAPEISSPWGLVRNWMAQRIKMQASGMDEHQKSLHLFGDTLDPEAFGFSLKVDTPVFMDGPLQLAGSTVSGVTVKHLPGHSPGSIGLVIGDGEEQILLCGDVLLDPITTSPDNLLVYLKSLTELKSMKRIEMALPGHGKTIRNVKDRISFFEMHHCRRLEKTYGGCSKAASIWDIAMIPGYFDVTLDPKRYNPLAGREVIAHLELLQMVDGIHRASIQNGIHYFRNSAEPFEIVYKRIVELVQDDRTMMIMRH